MPKIIITAKSLPHILKMIDTWEGKLTWDLLCKQTAIILDIEGGVKRQSLSSYKDIQDAYTRRKSVLKEHSSQPVLVEKNTDAMIEHLRKQVIFLEVEIERLTALNDAHKQRFLLWQYNAYRYGMRVMSLDEVPIDKSELKKLQDMLEKPLTEVKRRTGGR